MLEVVELSKRYKKVEAVRNVQLFIQKGEIVGLLGPNGAGKSTTISMMSSLIAPTSGDVRLNHESILKNPQKIRNILGVVPQEIALYEDLTARENLQFFGRIHGLTGSELKKKMEETLRLIGLDERKNQLVKTFSGGMKRRLNIGVALLHEPELLVMDEPTVGIDPQSRHYILETVKRLNKEKEMSVLYTSHYMEEVEYLCDRIYIMDRGQIIASGTKDEIKNILSSEQAVEIKVKTENQHFIHALQNHPSITNITEKGKMISVLVPKEMNFFTTIVHMAEETGTMIQAVDVKVPTLEDVFLHLTGRALRN
ncbi:ABC transporter ATP-binding protein [Bacillus sp. FJAT-47783]|uniref:ABC transporter ATP-binding protein n=1 Tax=Bacillus sp. FJAT-47783 TaxID=2922712 RepID=UPI001FAB96AD|nr:ABC transporter ATP-binding protein [Bacillus sp. FJAT-47783]